MQTVSMDPFTMKIIVFGDGVGTASTVRLLLDKKWQVVAVVERTPPRSTILENITKEHNLPLFHPAHVNRSKFINEIRKLDPDIILSIGYNQIFHNEILELPPLGCINFHPSKLPFYKGRNVVMWAMINGEEEFGITAHYMDRGIDTGPILFQETIKIYWNDTYNDIVQRLDGLIPSFVIKTLDLVRNGNVNLTIQDPYAGTYCGNFEIEDRWLDWTDSSYNLYNKIRAITSPGPGALSVLGQSELIIWKAYYDPIWPKYVGAPGQIIGRFQEEGVLIKTGDSMLLLQTAQTEGQPIETPKWRIGTRLGINLQTFLTQVQSELEKLR